jgi:hypothetical protein
MGGVDSRVIHRFPVLTLRVWSQGLSAFGAFRANRQSKTCKIFAKACTLLAYIIPQAEPTGDPLMRYLKKLLKQLLFPLPALA